jgi:hypothetical protein
MTGSTSTLRRASEYQVALYTIAGAKPMSFTLAANTIDRVRRSQDKPAPKVGWAIGKLRKWLENKSIVKTDFVDGDHFIQLADTTIDAIHAGRIKP